MSLIGTTLAVLFTVLAVASIGEIVLPKLVVVIISAIGVLVGYMLVVLSGGDRVEGGE